jgi:hypothetical protein
MAPPFVVARIRIVQRKRTAKIYFFRPVKPQMVRAKARRMPPFFWGRWFRSLLWGFGRNVVWTVTVQGGAENISWVEKRRRFPT